MRCLAKTSQLIANSERLLAGIFCALVFLLISANVLVRLIKVPIYWIDEAAIYAMIWMGFLAASSAIQANAHISVSLVTNKLAPQLQQLCKLASLLVMILFGLCLLWLSWTWFEPLSLLQHGGDIDSFTSTELNFIYTEPTATLGINKFWLWLIMPWFSFSLTFHSLAKFLSQLFEPAAPAGGEH